jgi:hypothetical protein
MGLNVSPIILIIMAQEALVINTLIETTFNSIQEGLTSLKTQIATLQQELKLLEKNLNVSVSAATQATHVSVSAATISAATQATPQTKPPAEKKQRKITGFCVQEPLSAELCVFMQLEPQSTSSRTTVSTFIMNYIRTQKLQDTTEPKNINADASLQSLFKLRAEDQLTYFNIQKYIGQQFN